MGVTIEATCGADAMVRALGLDHPDRWGSFAAGGVVKESARGFVRKFRWPEPDGQVFYFKLYSPGRRWKQFRSAFRKDPATREIENLQWLRQHGFPAVLPIAWGCKRTAGVVRSSFLVTRGEAGIGWLDAAAWELRRRRDLIAELGRLVRRMHDSGFYARDLYMRNVLVAADGRAGSAEPSFVLLDFPSAWILGSDDPRCGPAAVYDLATLDRGARLHFSVTDRARFLRSYLGRRRLDRDLVAAIEARHRRQMEKHRGPTGSPS